MGSPLYIFIMSVSQVLDRIHSSGLTRAFIYVVADKVQEKRWCPDCVSSDEALTTMLQTIDFMQGGFYNVEVSKPAWKDANDPHPVRKEWGVTNLPTILVYDVQAKSILARFVEGEVVDKVDEIRACMVKEE